MLSRWMYSTVPDSTALTGVPGGDEIPIPFRRMIPPLGNVARPKGYRMVPSTGQSSLPMSAVVSDPVVGAARPASPARRFRSSVASKSLRRLSSRSKWLSAGGIPGAAAGLAKSLSAFIGQHSIALQLDLALFSAATEFALYLHHLLPLPLHPVPQILDFAKQRFILSAGEIQIFIAAEKIAEGFGRQENLEIVQRPPLVDVHQASGHHGPLFREVVFRQCQVSAYPVNLGIACRQSASPAR